MSLGAGIGHDGAGLEGAAMSITTNGNGGRTNLSNARGDRTRDLLLDALEAIAADCGIGALSHRSISRRARLNTGLIHYHFGTVERLLEEALARRAARLSRMQLTAISALHAHGRWTVEDIVAALWEPFSPLGGTVDGGWRNYLCLVARLGGDERGDALLTRYFDDVARAALSALRAALPDADDESLRTGMRFMRVLFEQESLTRCRKGYPAERRLQDNPRLISFSAAGLRELAAKSHSGLVMPLRASGG
jgi:AcrR family transcriptional regulator